MAKIEIGRTRKKSSDAGGSRETGDGGRGRAAEAVFAFGAAAVCVMLAVSLSGTGNGNPEMREFRDTEAVMTMAGTGTVTQREELMRPSHAEAEEWCFYDYIGGLFAGLLFGDA